MRILVATDAWLPKVDGVVRALSGLAKGLRDLGVDVEFLTPHGMRTLTLAERHDLRLALPSPRRVAARLAAAAPDAVHIATAGPIGLAARWCCRRRGQPFTTSLHARAADRIAAPWPVPQRLGWRWLRWFHNAGRGTMAATAGLADQLSARGFRNVLRWPRGVDARLFRPRANASLGLLRPIFLSVARLTPERNLAAFLALDLPGTKVVVGDGPARDALARLCPNAVFFGARHGENLARIYAAADVLVFPGRTETFGLALLEALACGTPIAGFPLATTRDVVGDAPVAVLDEDLRAACLGALALSRTGCRAFAETMSWEEGARCFLANIERAGVVAAAAEAPRFKSMREVEHATRNAAEPAIG